VGRSVPHLRLIAYRAVSTCIDVLGGRYGVGGNVQVWEAQGEAPFRQLTGAELASVDNGVQQWTTIEAESLDQVVLEEETGEAAAKAEGVEMPEPLDPETGKK
jgi:hypothetical protein